MATVVDIECFFDAGGAPVIKEIAISTSGRERIISETFLPPCAWRCLPIHIRRKNAWITRCLNKFRWSDGELSYEEIEEFLKMNISSDSIVYAKGTMKCELLSSLIGRRVRNLEDLGCPKMKSLPRSTMSCPHTENFPSHTEYISCAVNKCRAFAKWLNESNEVTA